jgi:hypothetical protein
LFFRRWALVDQQGNLLQLGERHCGLLSPQFAGRDAQGSAIEKGMFSPWLNVVQAPGGNPEDLLGRIVELSRAHAQSSQQTPHRGVVRFEE